MRIARETLEIYAPIAQRLGMNLVKAELQNLGFRALHPWRHAVLEKRIRTQPLLRREALAKIEAQLAQRLTIEGLGHRLVGRVKSPWSIYSKMRAERSEEHTSELQSLMHISYAVFCLKKHKNY